MVCVYIKNAVYFRTYYYTSYQNEMQPSYTTKYKCCNGWEQLNGDNGCSFSEYYLFIMTILFCLPVHACVCLSMYVCVCLCVLEWVCIYVWGRMMRLYASVIVCVCLCVSDIAYMHSFY